MAIDRGKILQSAQSLAAKGQYEAAIAEWKKLAMEAPNDGSVHNSIGDLHLKRNGTADAVVAFLQAAAAFRGEGATLKAIATYKKVLKIDPTQYEVYRHLGDLNAERGLMSSAVQDYLTLGKYYLKERKGKEALEVYKRIVLQDPSNLDAQQRVAELCIQENLQDEATKVYLQLGRERSAQGRIDEARDAYLAVLRIDPKNGEAAQYVESVTTGGLPGSSSEKRVKPASGEGKSSEPADLLAEATRRLAANQYAGAEAILNQLLTREPGNPEVCQLLAKLHLQRGDIQVALGEYRFLAGAALRNQEYPLAETLIKEFLATEPNSVPILELYAQLHEEQGRAAKAAELYARAVELLIAHPEPGMESLHEELFEKVQALAPGSDLVAKLSVKLNGAGDPGTSVLDVAEPHCGADSAAVPADSVCASVSSPEAMSAALGTEAVAASHDAAEAVLSLVGAAPDEVVVIPDLVSERSALGLVEPPATLPSSLSADSEPDYEARYMMGVAYKNMGLYDDAMEEFAIARVADPFFLDAWLMGALCLKEQGQYRDAIRSLESVLSDPRCQGAKGQAVRYELGLLYETASLWEKAANIFETIPAFHDVPTRLASLKEKYTPAPTEFRYAS